MIYERCDVMAIVHDDGAVTLSAEDFRVCAAHLEMSPSRFLAFLTDHPEGFSQEDLLQSVMQQIELMSFSPETPPN